MSNATQGTVDGDPLQPTEISHRGFSASILIDGVPAPIYRPEYDTHNADFSEDLPKKRIRTCWIPSVEGKNFSVAFQNDEGEEAENASCAHIFVDGKDIASAIMRPARATPAVRDGAKLSPSVIKPFTFSKIQLTDDDTIADPNDPRTQDIGTIRIEIKFIRLGKVVPIKACDPQNIGPIHEKAKKASIHTTTYKTTKRIKKGRSVSTAPLYPSDEWEHHVVFIFRYRCADFLMAEGIMPRPDVQMEQNNADVVAGEEIPRDAAMNETQRPGKRPLEDDDEDSDSERPLFLPRSATPPKRMRMDYPSSKDDAGWAEHGGDIVPASVPSPTTTSTVTAQVETQDVAE
ncbi:hypothetical protein FRB96_007913 [Tulasnella sp. 330]|nr:hypothetical protein FRB96_007913 [Tulasnella sp. 330]KAG8869772.1 hypothetical protein FRB97_000753 [Tulasnella sp. 331]KAG8871839.1 hypothetical protein FRB98_000463 [Tulasnella sp. 332]